MEDFERDDNLLSLDRQLCFSLYAASNLLTRLYRPVLAKLGLTYPQYLVLLVLWERSPQTVGSLGERLYLDSGTLTPLLKRMEQAGLVTRVRDETDERKVRIDLTAPGKALRRPAAKIPQALGACIGVSEDEVAGLRAGARAFVATLRAEGTSPGKI